MRPFTYERAQDSGAAVTAASRVGAKYISGGTNLLDLMKLEIERPSHLVDIGRLPLKDVDELPDGGLRIGAQAANSDVAADGCVRTRYPVLSQALLAGASGQLRNKASVGGNLLQRTRCPCLSRIERSSQRMPSPILPPCDQDECAARQGETADDAYLGNAVLVIGIPVEDYLDPVSPYDRYRRQNGTRSTYQLLHYY